MLICFYFLEPTKQWIPTGKLCFGVQFRHATTELDQGILSYSFILSLVINYVPFYSDKIHASKAKNSDKHSHGWDGGHGIVTNGVDPCLGSSIVQLDNSAPTWKLVRSKSIQSDFGARERPCMLEAHQIVTLYSLNKKCASNFWNRAGLLNKCLRIRPMLMVSSCRPNLLYNWLLNLQVWEFDQDHQRWLPVAELALPGDKGDQVYSVAWAPNIGR